MIPWYILKEKCHKLLLRIIQEYLQPKIGGKIKIFSLARENNILIKKKSVVAFHIINDKQRSLDNELLLARKEWKFYQLERRFRQRWCQETNVGSRKNERRFRASAGRLVWSKKWIVTGWMLKLVEIEIADFSEDL